MVIKEKKMGLYNWRKTALLLTLLLVSIVSQIDRVLPFILSESIKTDLGLSDTQIGLLTGVAFTICYALASIPLARISDKGKAHKVLLWCIIIWSLMTGLGGFALGFMTLAISRIGVALGEAGGTPASHAIIAKKIPESFRGRAIGIFTMGIPIGTMIGFAIGGWANDSIGWRNVLFAAGISGVLVFLMVSIFIGKQDITKQSSQNEDSFLKSSKELFSKPAFLWLFFAAILMGFASAPFYIFISPFLIRTFELTASEVGLTFGLINGLTGIIGTLAGGKIYDRAVKKGARDLMNPPAIISIIASITTLAAIFVPIRWLSIILLIPGMFSFTFLLPFAFGAGHMIAGLRKKAFATSLLMLGSGLLGATIAPLLVGIISDIATSYNIKNGLQIGLLIIPICSLLLGLVGFIVSKKISQFLKQNKTDKDKLRLVK